MNAIEAVMEQRQKPLGDRLLVDAAGRDLGDDEVADTRRDLEDFEERPPADVSQAVALRTADRLERTHHFGGAEHVQPGALFRRGHSGRATLWAQAAHEAEATRNGSICMSMSRLKTPAADSA